MLSISCVNRIYRKNNSSVNSHITFQANKQTLKSLLKLLDEKELTITHNNNTLTLPEIIKVWDATKHKGYTYTKNFKLAKRITNHPYLNELREKQLHYAKSLILNQAKKDGTEAVIFDLDGTIFNETKKFNDMVNPFKMLLNTIIIKSGLFYKSKFAENLNFQREGKWFSKNDVDPILPVYKFLNTLQNNNIKIFAVCGREEAQRPYVLRNLHNLGIHFDDVYMKPPTQYGHGANLHYKPTIMAKLSQKYNLLGVIGDNKTDLLPANTQAFHQENIKNTLNILLGNVYYKTG